MTLSFELAIHFISLSNDDSGELTNSGAPFHEPHLERLVDEYYDFKDRLDDYLVSSFPDDDTISLDFWPDLGYIWLAVRMEHGVDFADCISDEFRHVADFARKVAKSQPYLEDGAYLGDDGMIYAYNYHE